MTGLRDRPDFTSALAGLETLRQRMTAQHEAARRALRGTMGDMAWAEHFQRQGQALVEAIAPALEALRPMLEFFAEIERGAAAFEATGLLPHPTMPRDLVNRGAEASRDEILAFYAENWEHAEEEFRSRIAGYDIDGEAREAFEEAIACHRTGLHRAAVRTLFPELERVYRSAFEVATGKNAASLEDLRKVLEDQPADLMLGFHRTLELWRVLEEHLYTRVKTDLDLARCQADTVPNRHAALHGLVVYARPEHSLNMLFMADFIFYLIHRLKAIAAEVDGPVEAREA